MDLGVIFSLKFAALIGWSALFGVIFAVVAMVFFLFFRLQFGKVVSAVVAEMSPNATETEKTKSIVKSQADILSWLCTIGVMAFFVYAITHKFW